MSLYSHNPYPCINLTELTLNDKVEPDITPESCVSVLATASTKALPTQFIVAMLNLAKSPFLESTWKVDLVCVSWHNSDCIGYSTECNCSTNCSTFVLDASHWLSEIELLTSSTPVSFLRRIHLKLVRNNVHFFYEWITFFPETEYDISRIPVSLVCFNLNYHRVTRVAFTNIPNPYISQLHPFGYLKSVNHVFEYVSSSNNSSFENDSPSECASRNSLIIQRARINGLFFEHDTNLPSLKKMSHKMLKSLNNRCLNVDPTTMSCSYIKKANHDTIFPQENYRKKYNEIRNRYYWWSKNWTEDTDAEKYVFEDIALATYLCCLWEFEWITSRNRPFDTMPPVRFVDLGCGNGLLTFILVSEGHIGVGWDRQKRKIWDDFNLRISEKEKTDGVNLVCGGGELLQIRDINPKVDCFQDVDWFIGNHSDELTPYIPLIAGQCLYSRFFVLPCCFFDFNEKKYSDCCSKIGKYHTYLNYIKKICEASGFTVIQEHCRIPSTKNICLVGMKRLYDENNIVLNEKWWTHRHMIMELSRPVLID